ncbi:MAG: hypothetical protein C4291_08635 [Candidatus Dadabacteria bacterium]
MKKAGWLFLFFLGILIPDYSWAVELTLGGYPSYFRIRPQFYQDSTFIGALDKNTAKQLGLNSANDRIFFVDSRLRLTPELRLSENVLIRAQVDVMDNVIWGGANSALERDVVFESLTPGDRFRGAILAGPVSVTVLSTGIFGNTLSPFRGRPPFDPAGGIGSNGFVGDDRNQYFNARMFHVDLLIPNIGYIRVGRQSYDFGLGILYNSGTDPYSDLGFIVDRLGYLAVFPLAGGNFSFGIALDRLVQGTTLIAGQGDGWEVGSLLEWARGHFKVAGYIFPYAVQKHFAGTAADTRSFTSALFTEYKTDLFRFAFEIDDIFGKVTHAREAFSTPTFTFPTDEIKVKPSNLVFAGRAEVYPGFPINIAAVEFGFAKGDKINGPSNPNIEGNAITFSPAYNIDNLLFKHIIPTIYGLEGSVINASYVRGWTTARLADRVLFTPQVLFAWNDERQALLTPDPITGASNKVGKFLGAEIEGTLTIKVLPNVNFDFIGSVVISGSGLRDLQEQRASLEVNNAAISRGEPPLTTPSDFSAPRVPFSFQGRLLVFIDQFFKK